MMMQQVAAVSIVVFKQGRFLLIKRKYAPYQGWLSFPGGKVEPQETAIEAAERELYEETSLIAGKLELLRCIDLHDEGEAPSSTLLNVYHALSTSGTVRPGDDASAAFWLNVTQMQQQHVIPSVLAVAKAMADPRAIPEKCEAVFGQELRKNKELEQISDSIESHSALGK